MSRFSKLAEPKVITLPPPPPPGSCCLISIIVDLVWNCRCINTANWGDSSHYGNHGARERETVVEGSRQIAARMAAGSQRSIPQHNQNNIGLVNKFEITLSEKRMCMNEISGVIFLVSSWDWTELADSSNSVHDIHSDSIYVSSELTNFLADAEMVKVEVEIQ